MQRPGLAIVLPTLDEREALADALADARREGDEVVVSDGGSTDGTAELACRLDTRVVTGPPGRGPQLNRGAAATEAPLLLFLHADTRLPEGAGEAVRQAIAGGACGGAFRLRFDAPGLLYRCGERLVDLRTRLTRAPLGDQGQFVTREAFVALGGFREWPILEDVDFARRLARHGRTVLLPHRVTTAARRYRQRGIARTVATNWLIWSLWAAGASPHRLARFYRQVR